MVEYFQRRPEQMHSMPPRKFEEMIAEIFRNNGFQVEFTPETRDGGLDRIAVNGSVFTGRSTHLIECKRYDPTKPVGIDVVQRLWGKVIQERATKGIVVAMSIFSRGARKVAEESRHVLVIHDYEAVVGWLRALRLSDE
jgi:restriction system protein